MSERGRNPSAQPALQGELEAYPVSEEEIKLAEIISSAPPRHPRSVLERLCGCFAPTHSRRPRKFKAASLLPPQREIHQGRATLVLDLDETLIHSTFQPGLVGDFVVEVDVESRSYLVSVFKRPGLHEFLQRCADLYEVVIFTASMSTYADRVIDVIDTENSVSARLFRESCTYVDGVYVKNLELLGRDLKRTIIVDVSCMQNSPSSYMFQPNNALPIKTWLTDKTDTDLFELLEELQTIAFEQDLTHILPAIANQLQDKIEVQRLAQISDNEDLPPVARPIPSSPPVPSWRDNPSAK